MEGKRFTNVDLDKTFYGKFVKNQEKIRNLAFADPDSFAAVVVESADCFFTGKVMLKDHKDEPLKSVCTETILETFADSLRASEIFALWTPDLLRNVSTMAETAIKREGRKKSDLDRNARMCFGMIGKPETTKFFDECRKKYPTEIFFHRIYCYSFTTTKEWEAGLKASDEACKLFPNDANILNARASMLRMIVDKGDLDYQHWSRLKKQVAEVKQAFKNYIKIAPKDHRHFADNNYFIAYFAFKYSTPSTQMMECDLQEISEYYQKGLNAEKDILPCFLPFTSEAKDFVAKHVNFEPSINVYLEGDRCDIDMTRHGMPGRPKTEQIVWMENSKFVDLRKPSKRRIDACVAHRQQLNKMVSNHDFIHLAHPDPDQFMDTASPSLPENYADDFEEIIFYQMTMGKRSQSFTSKVIQLTAVEDPLYDSGHIETIVADTTGDVIKLRLDLGAKCTDNFMLKRLIRKFRFGTVWKLANPAFHMENAEESTMYIRATPGSLMPVSNGQNDIKCRMCFKLLNPGHKCGDCKLATYCGKDCQSMDWTYIKHKLICSDAYVDFFK